MFIKTGEPAARRMGCVQSSATTPVTIVLNAHDLCFVRCLLYTDSVRFKLSKSDKKKL